MVDKERADDLGPGNLIGVHALVWGRSWGTVEALNAIEASARVGFDVVELPMFDPDVLDVASVRTCLDGSGCKATCSLGLPFDADVSSTDFGVARRGEALLRRVVEAAAAIGADFVGGVFYSALGKYSARPSARNWEQAVGALRRLSDFAASYGVTLGLEVVNRYESNLVNTAGDALRMLDGVARPNVVIHLDSYHMNIEERDMVQPVLACGARLGYVHVGESNRGYLGAGSADLLSLFGALRQVDYRGTITFESFSAASAPPDLIGTLAIWRDLWDEAEPLAQHALATIRSFLQVAKPAA